MFREPRASEMSHGISHAMSVIRDLFMEIMPCETSP